MTLPAASTLPPHTAPPARRRRRALRTACALAVAFLPALPGTAAQAADGPLAWGPTVATLDGSSVQVTVELGGFDSLGGLSACDTAADPYCSVGLEGQLRATALVRNTYECPDGSRLRDRRTVVLDSSSSGAFFLNGASYVDSDTARLVVETEGPIVSAPNCGDAGPATAIRTRVDHIDVSFEGAGVVTGRRYRGRLVEPDGLPVALDPR